MTVVDDQSKITPEELEEWFGTKTPIETLDLLFNSPETTTIGEIRESLRLLGMSLKEQRLLEDHIGSIVTKVMGECFIHTSSRPALMKIAWESYNLGKEDCEKSIGRTL